MGRMGCRTVRRIQPGRLRYLQPSEQFGLPDAVGRDVRHLDVLVTADHVGKGGQFGNGLLVSGLYAYYGDYVGDADR